MTPAARPRSRRRWIAWLRLVLVAAVIAAVGFALVSSWDEVAPYLSGFNASAIVLALLCALAAPVLTMLGWRSMLASLGSPLPAAPAGAIFFVAQLGKYVPGSIWAIVAQAEMGARFGVPRRRVGVVGLLSIALALLTGAVIGLPSLPVLLGSTELGGLAIVLVVILLAVACYPPVLNWGVSRALTLLRRPQLEHPLTGRAIIAMLTWFTLAWVSSGLMVLVTAVDLAGVDWREPQVLLGAVCGFALASAFGMISVLFPAGVGVRDGFLALVLAATMPLAAAVAVAVIVRFLTIVIDLLVASVGWWWGHRHRLAGGDAGGDAGAGAASASAGLR